MAGKLGVAKVDRKAVLLVALRVDWKVFSWAESTVVLLALQNGMQKVIPRGFL